LAVTIISLESDLKTTMTGVKPQQKSALGLAIALLIWGCPSPVSALPIALDVPDLGHADRFLPPVVQQRLILRLGDRRVYLYENDEVIASYPVAIGRQGWETPTGEFKIIQKIPHPTWQHPFTNEIIPPGPENPLGDRWIGFWTDGKNFIGFHGTPNEDLIGQAVSHGCVRMRNADIVALFEKVAVGMQVIVEN
jgi:lipoprotein-anchoring transpeptidase ErfK/SrfK